MIIKNIPLNHKSNIRNFMVLDCMFNINFPVYGFASHSSIGKFYFKKIARSYDIDVENYGLVENKNILSFFITRIYKNDNF